ncbi:MAG: ABC transporter ATP-binding protein [Actinobacteria bacterium]|nr:ABC transporter ATP-binding protein [Actinomycetota bacterium]
MKAIETRALTRLFGSLCAVDNLTMAVPCGQVYGFLGPNGAGKTTTLKMLAGLISPSSGTALVAGKEMRPGESSRELRSRVGFLAEDPAFYPWMTAYEALVFTARLHGSSAARAGARAAELLDTVGLSPRAEDRIRGFSRGMRQRLGIALALAGEPDVLLLDEPASALDPIGRKEILDLISSLRGRATILMSSHVLDDVQRVGTWVGILDKGRMVVESPLDDLLHRYATPAFHLEISGDRTQVKSALLSRPWVQGVVEEAGGLRIIASDLQEAQRSIASLLAAEHVSLLEFATVVPTLEDVFLRIVSNNDNADDVRAEQITT